MKLTEKLAEKSRIENTRNTALEKISSRLSTKTERKEGAALVVESSGQCPDCGKTHGKFFWRWCQYESVHILQDRPSL